MQAVQYSFGETTAREIPAGVTIGALVQTHRAPINSDKIDFSYRQCMVVDIRTDTAEVEVELVDGYWAGQRVWMFAENCEVCFALDGGPVASSPTDIRVAWEYINVKRRNETPQAYEARFEKYFYENYRAFTF
jgi:hypothetical protein